MNARIEMIVTVAVAVPPSYENFTTAPAISTVLQKILSLYSECHHYC